MGGYLHPLPKAILLCADVTFCTCTHFASKYAIFVQKNSEIYPVKKAKPPSQKIQIFPHPCRLAPRTCKWNYTFICWWVKFCNCFQLATAVFCSFTKTCTAKPARPTRCTPGTKPTFTDYWLQYGECLGKITKSVHCTITGSCLRMRQREAFSTHTFQHVTVPIRNIYLIRNTNAVYRFRNLSQTFTIL